MRGRRRKDGFTLLEVLEAIIVFAVGLLGIAALQVHTLRDSQSSTYRSIATQQAYDIADRMVANRAGVAEGDYDNLSAEMPRDPKCFLSGCSAAGMAVTDHYQWLTVNAAMLPGGTGTVRCVIGPTPACAANTPGSNRIFDVRVLWTERGSGDNIAREFITRFSP
ncbi:type IV pilus modification protein PilV [uncultured Thiodictyon sp.]|uniref:type IV pilus modification protein PilV n=1 Tax=uncultured Thiodictyon sp. TaxID=1846217 RepID=UPI0025CE9431|nr:type IV pilus modification protein PilV [uncultured Thiodictyon sp.]